MVTYIYFVKCPGCEDEHFDFFDDAKGFAMGCLSNKPIITQTEVCRNDFGECTDHCDLGTVWSWEDAVGKDDESKTPVFTKDNLKNYDPDNDPEFADDPIGFLIDDEEEAVAGYEQVAEVVTDADFENKEEILDTIEHIKEEEEEHIEELEALADTEEDNEDDDFRSINGLEEAVTAGISFKNMEDFAEFKKLCDEIGILTMGDVKNFMQENDADASNILDKLRAYRAELGPDFKIKEAYTDPETECIYNDNIECTNNEDCTDCPNNPKAVLRKPVPEGMTIEQLVETMEENEDEVECTWCNDLFPKDICKKEVNLGYLCPRCADGIMSRGETLTFKQNNYWDFLDERFDRDPFDHHDAEYNEEEAADAMADHIDAAKDKKYDDALDSLEEPLPDSKINEGFDSSEEVNLEYDELTVTLCGNQRDADDWDEVEHSDSYTYTVDKVDVATTIWENFITEEDVKDIPGGLETLEDNDEWYKFLETHFDILFDKYYDKLLDYYEEAAADEFRDNYSYSDHYDDLRSAAEDDAYDAWRDEQWN